jgi:hypothetical protein
MERMFIEQHHGIISVALYLGNLFTWFLLGYVCRLVPSRVYFPTLILAFIATLLGLVFLAAR